MNAVGMTGNASFTRSPVAGRQVVKHEGQIVIDQSFPEFADAAGVGELTFNRREPRSRRGGEAIQKGDFGEERRQVCGELQSALPAAGSTDTFLNISARTGKMKEKR